ncbi:MAG: isoprenylcysteine carboxylmethyltransferase family protein [Blastomonas sp.]
MSAHLPEWSLWAPAALPMAWIILALITLQRLAELVYSNRNTGALLLRGATEHGRSHYPAMVAIHATFLLALWVAVRPHSAMIWPVLILVILLQMARFWVLATLGPYWTTRIISAPGFPRIAAGPYRFVRHPNYVVVTLEILFIPLMFGQIVIAAAFSILNAAILYIRIRTENEALALREKESV